MGRVHLHF